jgi:hypothetical protein
MLIWIWWSIWSVRISIMPSTRKPGVMIVFIGDA